MDGPEFEGTLNERFLDWLGALPLDGVWPTVLLDLVALALVGHAVVLRRAGYRWWSWPLPAATVVLGLALLAAVNAWRGTYPDVASLLT
jgi:hypothetical protein